jgi:HK97 family phage portal protein
VGLRLPWRAKRPAERSSLVSISDPVAAQFFGVGYPNYSGAEVNEYSALGLSAVYRAVSLIAGTIGSLPLRTLRDTNDGMRQRVNSFLDDPGGADGATAYEWKETILCHLLLHGNAFLLHIFGGAGQIIGLYPVHPLLVVVDWDSKRPGGKVFKASLGDGIYREYDAETMTHIPALSVDGLRGLSPIAVARNSFGTAIAGDRAAARMFGNGALISGIVSTDEELEEDEATQVKETISRRMLGWENASDVAFINRKIKFTPWTMSAQDSQFLQSRAFQIEEIARWFGVPPHLLMQTDKQTSWGTGVEEQNLGLGRFTLNGWTCRIEQRLSRLLPNPRFVEFDYAGLERPTPEDEINLLIAQVNAGLLTVDEARAIRNLPPLSQPTPADQAQNDPSEVPA